MVESPGTDSGYASFVILLRLLRELVKKEVFTGEEVRNILAVLAEQESKSTEAAGKRIAPALRKLSEQQF